MEGEMWDRRKPSAAGLAQLAEAWLQMNAVQAKQPWTSHGYDQPLAHSAARIQAHLQAYADWVEAEFPAGRAVAAACLGLIERRREVMDELSAAQPALCFCKAD